MWEVYLYTMVIFSVYIYFSNLKWHQDRTLWYAFIVGICSHENNDPQKDDLLLVKFSVEDHVLPGPILISSCKRSCLTTTVNAQWNIKLKTHSIPSMIPTTNTQQITLKHYQIGGQSFSIYQ